MPDGAKPQGCSGSVFLKEAQTEELGGPKIVENFLDKYDCSNVNTSNVVLFLVLSKRITNT